MHQRIQELFAYLSVRRESLSEAVDAVPPPLRERRPADDRWSVAEVLEHLALVEARFAKVLGDRLAEARASGLAAEQETSSIVPSYDLSGILDRTTKHAAPEVVRPQGSDSETAWSRLEEARRSFLDV